MTLLEKFFCFLGGAKLSILKEHLIEKNNFIAIGIGVLNTTLLSMFTMGYAISAVINDTIENWSLLIIFSIFWGLIIFGIDWGLITTMRKKAKYNLKSRTALVFTTLFRITVAIVISFTVSRPLEVIIFKDFLPLARREAQLNFQKDLDSDEKQKVTNSEKSVLASQKALDIWNQKGRIDLGENDQNLIVLEEEKKLYDNRYKEFNKQKIIDDRISDKNINNAQKAFNTIQSQINSKLSVYRTNNKKISSNNNAITNYRNSNSKMQDDINFIDNQENKNALQRKIISNNNEISILENNNRIISQKNKRIDSEITRLKRDQSPHQRTINNENQNKQNRKKDLTLIDTQLSTTLAKIKTQNNLLDNKANSISDSLKTIKSKYEIIKDTISKKAEIEFVKNKKATSVFDKDNLINNLIAVGYLEKWDTDQNADLGKKEISKKVKFLRLLLIILIIIVDIAPIVIKLLLKRGMYDVFLENIEKTKKYESISKLIAYKEVYPKIAEIEAKTKASKYKLENIILSHVQFLEFYEFLQNKNSETNNKVFKRILKAKDGIEEKVYYKAFEKSQELFYKTTDKLSEIFSSYLKKLKDE